MFTIRTAVDLERPFKQLGARRAFNHSADFSGISPAEPLEISFVRHESMVRVDEKGTEAAAGTGLVLGSRGAGGSFRYFVADRPFLFIMREARSGTILFIGHVMDPR